MPRRSKAVVHALNVWRWDAKRRRSVAVGQRRGRVTKSVCGRPGHVAKAFAELASITCPLCREVLGHV